GKQAICYCTSVKHSQEMAKQFNDAGIDAAHLDGETPKPERERIVEAFLEGRIDILCNVDLISEGFDVPDCECAILLRPTQSLTLYIQQSMRCMRYKPGKRAIIIDHVGNYARFGLPDQDREWTLEGKKRRGRQDNEESLNVRQCPKCFCTFASLDDSGKPVRICPQCGFEFPKKERKEIEQEQDAEIVKIEGFTLDLQTPDDCVSYKELLQYAKKRGYKPGWVYYQAKKRGFIA
ncbi:MAG: helicase, partial [Ruminococcus sp.]|nr:helicase [Ruminococcus sp.]